MSGLEVSEDFEFTNLNDKQKILLLDKVFFKILSSATDLDFEENLAIYLPKLIAKLATNEELIRKKVMEILVHINKRIKSRPSVQLPLDDLLANFNNPIASSSFVANFSLIYIKLAFPRLADKAKTAMIEKLLASLPGKSQPHQDSLMSLVVDGLKHIELKVNDNTNKLKYGMEDAPKLRKSFLDYLFYFLLLPYSPYPPRSTLPSVTTTTTTSNQPPSASAALSPSTNATTVSSDTPACMSDAIYKQFKKDIDVDNGDELEQLKIGILKFLAYNIYSCEEVLFHFIVGTSDTKYTVVQAAELHIKRMVGAVDLNEPVIVKRFFDIFLGSAVLKSPSATTSSNPANGSGESTKIEAANTRIRLKLFPYMLRSRLASSTMPQAIQVVFDGLFGKPTATNAKIKLYSVQFVHSIALNCETAKLSKIGTVLIQGMNKLIAEAREDNKLRGQAYVAVGKLARKMPTTIAGDMSIVHNFFSALESEDSDTKMHIQEALVLMIEAFKNGKAEEKKLLLTLLFKFVENEVTQCRAMAVKFAFEIFEQDELESRYLLILASADGKEEIRQEAVKYLRRTHDPDGNELRMASFEQWVEFISNKIDERIRKNYRLFTFGTHTLAIDINCYQEILSILRLALTRSAGLKGTHAIDVKSLDTAKDEAPHLVAYVSKLSACNLPALVKYVNIVKEYALVVSNPLGMYMLLEICSITPMNSTEQLFDHIEWLKTCAFSANEQVRFYSAELWALTFINRLVYTSQPQDASSVATANFDCLFDELIAMSKTNLRIQSNKSYECKHGSILCIGYAIARYYYLLNGKANKPEHDVHIEHIIADILAYVDDSGLSLASIVSLGEVIRNGRLVVASVESMVGLVDTLVRKIQTSQEKNKLKERAAATLGYMGIHTALTSSTTTPTTTTAGSEPSFVYTSETKTLHFTSFNKYVIQRLLDSSQAKQVELNMAIGEAITNCVLGHFSAAHLSTWLTAATTAAASSSSISQDVEMTTVENTGDSSATVVDERVHWLLDHLLTSYMNSSNQHLRQAACFWLLILVKKCSEVRADTLTANLSRIQDAFIQRLGENDEITQEVASKGIGVLFSLADESAQKNLVARLVDTLTGGGGKRSTSSQQHTVAEPEASSTATRVKITDENEPIFQADQIGKTPEGGNITTYKELCSLASDLNRPDLVYQFMNLAHHNSVWNTRRGAAFGFHTIVQMASAQLEPYLSSLVPKLYRYQFDPNPRIQQSMSSIWSSLVHQDNKKILDQYMVEILADLEANMHAPLWRVRESCCAALGDLLKGGRNLEAISGRFGSFWSLLFKLADDIKESVRVAAELALKSLQRITIAYATAVSSQAVCEATMSSVLPVLIQTGLQSNLAEIRSMCVLTIRDLVKQSSSFLIKPYVVEMIVHLLETLSGYEPPDLNYISLKLNSADAQEKLDMARIAASKNTPMLEIINMNMNNLNDDAILAELIPRLIEIVRRGLGVSTKAGVCHIIGSLVDLAPTRLAPYAGKLMAALVNSMSTESAANRAVTRCYCAAIGSVVKVAKESSVENLLNKLHEWYFERVDDQGIKLSCALALQSIVQNNADVVVRHGKLCIPFVFFAMHQQSEQAKARQELQQQRFAAINQRRDTNDENSSNNNNNKNDDGASQFKLDLFIASLREDNVTSSSGSNNSDERSVSSILQDVWEDVTSGIEFAIRANLCDILRVVRAGLEHQSWSMRVQASLALRTISAKLQSNIELAHFNDMLSMLITALNARIWTGKDKVLLAVSSIFVHCKLKLSFDNPLVDELIRGLFKEASKQSSNIELTYKLSAVACLSDALTFASAHFKDAYFEQYWSEFVIRMLDGELATVRQREQTRQSLQLELFKSRFQIDAQVPAESAGQNQKEEENKDDGEKEEAVVYNVNLKLIVLISLGKAWSFGSDIQEKHILDAILLLGEYLTQTTWTNQLLILKTLDMIVEKWSMEFEENNVETLVRSIEVLTTITTNCISKTKYSNLKRDGLIIIERLIDIVKHEKSNEQTWKKLIQERSRVDKRQDIISLNDFIVERVVETWRVLLEEFTFGSNIELKEKAKAMHKLLNLLF